MALHYKHWVYVAVNAIASECARNLPNFAYIRYRDEEPRSNRSAFNRSLETRYRKSLGAIKPHEEVKALEWDHPLNRLLRHPNDVNVSRNLIYELVLFLELMGNSYVWKVPNHYGLPCELWVIPAHWVWPRVGTKQWVEYYEIRPWVGPGTLRFPPEEVIHFQYPSPIHKLDGWSKLTAGAEWVDAAESVDRCRFYQFKNGCFPMGALELSAEFHDPDDQDLERLYAKFFARAQGEWNYGRPIVMPPGAKYTPLMISPMEMAYVQSADQLRDWTLALFRVPKEIAGIQDAGSEIAMYGPMQQFCRFCISPIYQLIAENLTKDLCSQFGENIRCWWDDPTPDSPEQVNKDIVTDFQCGAITPNEVRSIRGREPYEHGGDDPLLPMGVGPMPLNTGEDLAELGMTPAESARYLAEANPQDAETQGEPVPTESNGHANGNGKRLVPLERQQRWPLVATDRSLQEKEDEEDEEMKAKEVMDRLDKMSVAIGDLARGLVEVSRHQAVAPVALPAPVVAPMPQPVINVQMPEVAKGVVGMPEGGLTSVQQAIEYLFKAFRKDLPFQINVPTQPAPQVNVEVKIPDVTPTINLPPAMISVNVPQQEPPVVNLTPEITIEVPEPRPLRRVVERDDEERIAAISEE